MTMMQRRSRGIAHSLAIKRGIHRLPDVFADSHDEQMAAKAARVARVWHGMLRLAAEADMLSPDPDALERELRECYRRGYIRALLHVKRERERIEAMSYAGAMKTVTRNEMRQFSHVFERSKYA